MLNIPYVSSSKNACALACYTMVAKYFFPETTFKNITKITEWEPGYIVWAFKFWLWIMNKGIKIEDYDLMSLQAWADKGIEGLKKSVPSKEFDFYKRRSKDLKSLRKDIRIVMKHKNFTYHQQRPKFDDLIKAINKGKVCEVVLDSRTLDKKEGFSLHRIVILGINIKDQYVIFHDPRPTPRPSRKESIKLFSKAWLEATGEPELCVYSRQS